MGKGEKELIHHWTGDRVMDALTLVRGGSRVKRDVPRKHLTHYRERNSCSDLLRCTHRKCQRTFVIIEGKAMAPHSSTLAWKIPWMEEPGRLQSMGSLRVGHN